MPKTTEAIHAARLDEADGSTWWFVSLDGELWLTCSGDPRKGMTLQEVQAAFGPQRGSLPMRIARNFLEMIGARFLKPKASRD